MLLHSISLSLVFLAAFITPPAATQLSEPTRRIEVHVTVTTNGAPFPEGTYVSMGVPGDIDYEIPGAPTDARGRALLVGQLPASVTQFVVDIPTVITWGPPEQLDARNEAATVANKAFSLPPPRLVRIATGQEVYTVDLFAQMAITVNGRAVDDGGKPVSAHAERGGLLALRLHPGARGGIFEVCGVPKGQDSFLFLSTDRPDTHVIWLTAAQTGSDLNLGNVGVPAVTSDADIEISVTDRAAVRSDLGFQDSLVTLIHQDGLIVYTLKITEHGGVTTYPEGEDETAHPKVAPGRYYIVPGMSNTSDSSLKVLRLIRAGKHALLDAAGVPVIEPVSGQTTSGAIDLAAVQQIIDRLPESK